jgi:tetratricopeptide (TPR) repeat protein
MKRLIMIIALLTQLHLAFGEENLNDVVANAFGLLEKGRYEAAISMLTSVAQSPSTHKVIRGRAWTVLGFAYKQDGQFEQARRCYEQALRIFNDAAILDSDRAAALDYFGNLELDMGNLADGLRLLTEALQIDEKFQDHQRLSTVYAHLAGIAIQQKHYKDAKKYLESSEQEANSVVNVKQHLLADIYGTRGWLASATGKKKEAVEDYKRSLEACEQQFGNQHPLTGWAYLLLGKATAEDGNVEEGMKSIRDGLAILEATSGTQDLRCLAGEIAYSKLLDRSGAHAESARLATEAKQEIASRMRSQCSNCTVSVWSFQQK